MVEDEEKVASFIIKGLIDFGFDVTHAKDCFSAIGILQQVSFDLIILDVMLPDSNGVDLCRQIRQHDHNIPILMLTAMGQVNDKVLGFNAGADDYLTKPFHFSELVVRLNALLRRNRKENIPKSDEGILTFSDLKLNT